LNESVHRISDERAKKRTAAPSKPLVRRESYFFFASFFGFLVSFFRLLLPFAMVPSFTYRTHGTASCGQPSQTGREAVLIFQLDQAI
jgi:hypothetical protein